MTKVFISYRRNDSSSLATLIAKELTDKYQLDVFVDTRRVDGGGLFPDRLRRAIENADVFICLLGETTLDSEWVRNEIEHAHNLGKKMIPVFQERYKAPNPLPDKHVETLLQFDGVHIFDIKNIYIDQAIKDIAEIIKTSARKSKRSRRNEPWVTIIAAIITITSIILATFIVLNIRQESQSPIATDVAIEVTQTIAPTVTLTQEPTPTIDISSTPEIALTSQPKLTQSAAQTTIAGITLAEIIDSTPTPIDIRILYTKDWFIIKSFSDEEVSILGWMILFNSFWGEGMVIRELSELFAAPNTNILMPEWCYILEIYDSPSRYPTFCSREKTFIKEILSLNVFWFDSFNKMTTSIVISDDKGNQVFCAGGADADGYSECALTLPVP